MESKSPALLPALNNVVCQLQAQGRRDIVTVEALLDKFTGDYGAGKMLRRLLYWFPKAKHPEGWVYKSWKDWDAECALTEGMLKRVHRKGLLEAVGIERNLKKAAGTPTNHYRLDVTSFIRKLAQFLNIAVETLHSWLYLDSAQTAETEPPAAENHSGISAQSIRQIQPPANSMNDPIHSAQTAQSITTRINIETNNQLPTKNNNNTVSVVVPAFMKDDVEDRCDKDIASPAPPELPADLPEFPGIAPRMMFKLVADYGLNRARAVIAYTRRQTTLHNPPAFIVARIRDNQLGLEHPDEVRPKDLLEDGKRFIQGEYADFIHH